MQPQVASGLNTSVLWAALAGLMGEYGPERPTKRTTGSNYQFGL